ncbi:MULTISPECIES: hypothetical protein [Vibrio]|uniref:hypothetical protein n=1 Tax=Vibrio TaxID=662 RepID=UPI0001B95A3E|nr:MULTISPECIES: hypothetical protein [Vibrio]EEX34387.1 metal dependent phosphohydrolase [Vibrio coralliilyticus ATCC BAA-450]MDE3898429.1 hypothetical protein [Vibrio sp. CC007]
MKLTEASLSSSKIGIMYGMAKTRVDIALKSSLNWLKRQTPPYVPPSSYRVPDTLACKKALTMARENYPDFILNHSLRTYAYGLALEHLVKNPVNKEVFFVGTILHYIGLELGNESNDSFELVGAKTARQFAISMKLAHYKADRIHEMIAQQNSFGVTHRKVSEVTLLQMASKLDLTRLWIKHVNPKTSREIKHQYPDHGLQSKMINFLEKQIHETPSSNWAIMKELGFLEKIKHRN